MVDVLALSVLLPDDAPYDPIAYATGAEGFDQGVTWEELRSASHGKTLDEQEQPGVMMAWRRSYMEGYLAAMCVRARQIEAGRFEAWTARNVVR